MAISTLDPTTGQLIRSFVPLAAAEIDDRLTRSIAAFRAQRAVPIEVRAQCLRRAAAVLRDEQRRHAKLMTSEMGKPIAQSVAEIEKCASACDYYADKAAGFLADERVSTDAAASFIRYEPLGPVLAIMPWNFPFWQVFRFAAPALAAGNCGLLKHASNVPQCALAIEDILARAGFAQGAFQALLVGAAAVSGIIADERVRAVTLTGSDAAGRSVAAQAGKNVKKTVLELGGSDPFVVLPSADVSAAAAAAVTARTINNGQSCIAAKRFIVHDDVAQAFEREFVQRFGELVVGDPADERTDVGPLATQAVLETVADQVDALLADGAKALIGGKRMEGAGYFYSPTVLTNVRTDVAAAREEIFGPVALLHRARSFDDAMRMANDTPFGLGASVWTRDPGEQTRAIDELQAGAVFVNGMVRSDPRMPFGGIKQSGYGRELARQGIMEFVNAKTVWIDKDTT